MKKTPKLLKDLGMRYATETSKQKTRYGLYECSYCGTEFETQMQSVKSGRTQSCGCYNKQVITIHGLTQHRLYNVWKNMLSRCGNPRDERFKDYGGRNIRVCDRWQKIENFIEDMYPTYKNALTIDRIDNDGNYEPGNCRWATAEIQAQNTRKIMSTNTSGYRGVSYHTRVKKWVAQIAVNNKHIHLGIYNTAIEAAKVRDQYVLDHHLHHTLNGVTL